VASCTNMTSVTTDMARRRCSNVGDQRERLLVWRGLG
jgi:hypothetical protein